MSSRKVEITINGDPGLGIDTNSGLPQGSPVSPVLFLIYIADLATLVESTVPGVVALSFVDDVTWIVDGVDDAEVTVKLNTCAAKCLTWAQDNAVRFEEDKTEAILWCASRRTRPKPSSSLSAASIRRDRKRRSWLMEVFDAELYALYEALRSARRLHDSGHAFRKTAIFSDAQAALLRLRNNDEGPGQCIGGWISCEERKLRRRNVAPEPHRHSWQRSGRRRSEASDVPPVRRQSRVRETRLSRRHLDLSCNL
jgi:hypothetical protein